MSATGLPPHLVELFVPRKPLPYLEFPKKRPQIEIGGLADLMSHFETEAPPAREEFKDFIQRRMERAEAKKEAHRETLRELRAQYDPMQDPKLTFDRLRTLFVGRLSYMTTEDKLRREMETFGRVSNLRVVRDGENRSRGYAFVEFEDREGLQRAVNERNVKIDGRVVLIDRENGRNIDGWLPRRLGGGKGPERLGRPKPVGGYALQGRGRFEPSSSFRGGRGGGRGGGGFRGGRGGGRGGYQSGAPSDRHYPDQGYNHGGSGGGGGYHNNNGYNNNGGYNNNNGGYRQPPPAAGGPPGFDRGAGYERRDAPQSYGGGRYDAGPSSYGGGPSGRDYSSGRDYDSAGRYAPHDSRGGRDDGRGGYEGDRYGRERDRERGDYGRYEQGRGEGEGRGAYDEPRRGYDQYDGRRDSYRR